ncbi:MAG: LD-carboxypeptidase [Bacteroidota bacterium]
MNRKQFLAFFATTGLLMPLRGLGNIAETESGKAVKIPAFLSPGDTIGITSPASYITLEEIQPAVQLLESWGFKTAVGSTIGTRDFTLGGTDEMRAADFQQMLDRPDIKAVMCARGGYGVVRMIDQLDFTKFKKQPKWIIGFSDITALHAHINSNFGIASIHSKMCNSFPSDWTKASPMQIETILSIRQVLSGQPTKYTAAYNANNRLGATEGILVGGNLSMIETLAGSKSDLTTDHKILFIEDTREQLYSIDRMLWNLKRSGKLNKLKALIIGGFKVKEDDPGEEFGRTVYQLVMEKVREFNYPVCFDFPVGHQVTNYALKCGSKYKLEVGAQESSLVSI